MPREHMRLDALLARAGLGTRQQVRRLLRTGVVHVDDTPTKKGATQVSPTCRVEIDGEAIAWPRTHPLIMLHKPVGYACSHNPREAPIVDALLTADLLAQGFQPVGRLDRHTSGLLLLTNQGTLLHRLTHPKHHVPKRYRVTFEGTLPSDAVATIAAGMRLERESTPTAPAELTEVTKNHATLVLREGRYHQVRRMFAALGVHVTALHRDRIGALELPKDLAPGTWREIESVSDDLFATP